MSESALCRIAGVDRSRRRVWAEQGHVRRRGQQGYGELDAAELAVFRLLVAELDFERARQAWDGVRLPLRDSLLAGVLLVVLDEGRAEAILVREPRDLFEAAGSGGRFHVVDVSAAVADALVGFRNVTRVKENRAQTSEKGKKVQKMRKKSSK